MAPESSADGDALPPPAGPEEAAVVRLLRRRHRWAVAAWCVTPVFAILLLAVVVAYVQARDDGDALPPGWQLGLVVGAPGAASVIAIAMVIAAGRRLSRVPAGVRERAAAVRGWRPPRVRARRDRVFGWVVRTVFWAFVLGYQVLLVFLAPAVVNGAAYLAGAGPSVTFVPQSHQRDCNVKGGCHTVTLGVLETGRGPVGSDWPAEVPLGRPFSVPAPVWFWGGGRELVHGKGGALEAVGFGLLLAFFECVLAFLASLSLRRRRLPRSRERGGGRHERAG